MARPSTGKYNNLITDIIEYTKNTKYPILKELCYQKHYNYDYVMQLQRNNEELSQSIKELLYKKEAYLEREGIKGHLAQTMAVFTLKQLGWRDNVEIVDNQDINKNLQNIAELINKPKPNRTEKDIE